MFDSTRSDYTPISHQLSHISLPQHLQQAIYSTSFQKWRSRSTASFQLMQPFGQLPAFEDGDLKLFESRAITRYIAHAYSDNGTPFVSKDLKKMAIVSVWEEVEGQRYEPPAFKLTWELYIKQLLGLTTDDAVVEEQEALLAKVLDVYEGRLVQSKYLGGDCFTLADLHHLPTMDYLMGTRVKAVFESRPHVKAWSEDIMARPAWQKVIAWRNNQ